PGHRDRPRDARLAGHPRAGALRDDPGAVMTRAAGLLVGCALAGCASNLLDEEEWRPYLPMRNKVDLIFMIDDSNSMGPAAEELRDRIPSLLDFLAEPVGDLNVDLHVAVVTSDYGAGATGAPSCQASPGGTQGRFQVDPKAATVSCGAGSACMPGQTCYQG